MRQHFISFGAGVQTSAMLLMPEIMKNVDEIIFADTGSEHRETYQHIENNVIPYLREMGIPFTTVRMHRKVTIAEADYMPRGKITVPSGQNRLQVGLGLSSGTPSGRQTTVARSLKEVIDCRKRIPSMNSRWCTEYAKITPIKLKIREYQKEGIYSIPATSLVGITFDEKHRAIFQQNTYDRKHRIIHHAGEWKQPHLSEYLNGYPLVEKQIYRDDCVKLLKEYGWIVPKSGCTFCPYQGGKQFAELYWNDPEEFWDAVRIEEQDPKFPKYRLYQRKSLRRFASELGEGTIPLADDYDGGMCNFNGGCMT